MPSVISATPVPSLSKTLESVEKAAGRLNDASDSAKAKLASIEARLRAANIGLEIWLVDPPLDVSDSTEKSDSTSRVERYLGLARIGSRWCLAVKADRIEQGYFEGDRTCPYVERYSTGEPAPLLSASRGIRIAALRLMPRFLELLSEHISKTVTEIEGVACQLDWTGPA